MWLALEGAEAAELLSGVLDVQGTRGQELKAALEEVGSLGAGGAAYMAVAWMDGWFGFLLSGFHDHHAIGHARNRLVVCLKVSEERAVRLMGLEYCGVGGIGSTHTFLTLLARM